LDFAPEKVADPNIAAEVGRYNNVDQAITARMPDMVKGALYMRPGGGAAPAFDDAQVLDRAFRAEQALRKSVRDGLTMRAQGADIRKALSPAFAQQFPMFMMDAAGGAMSGFLGQIQEMQQALVRAGLMKDVTLTSPLATSFAPFDLVAPTRLIHPMLTPFRNRYARTPGQGISHRAKVVTGISGSHTGSSGGAPVDISIAESNPASSWPTTLPGSGTQNAVDLTIPYRFHGLTESLSWLAQFAGQGFDDISALANLILLQEVMLSEEHLDLDGTATALVVPGAPTATIRTAGSNETAVPNAGGGNSYYIRVTARNFWGETTMSAAAEAAVGATTTDVIDLTLPYVRGSTVVNIYISAAATSGSAPSGRTSYFLLASGVGGRRYTIQGPTLPTSGTSPPAADSGTFATTRQEGLLSVISGHASVDGSPLYPSGVMGSYWNRTIGKMLSTEVVNDALAAMWDGAAPTYGSNESTAGAYRADPSDIMAEGSDIRRLAEDVIANPSNMAYRLMINQAEVSGVRAGAAVSEFQNPITRSVVRMMVHPWMYQGSAYLLSWTLPWAWSNTPNVFEKVLVQDYLSVGWPVIDPTFRYSLFFYGSLFFTAPQYLGLMAGLQISDTTPYK